MTNHPVKMRTVRVGSRGQLVIPEEMRKDLDIQGDSIIVVIEDGDRLILRREQDVLQEGFWTKAEERALARAWHDEDAVWDTDREAT